MERTRSRADPNALLVSPASAATNDGSILQHHHHGGKIISIPMTGQNIIFMCSWQIS